MARFAGAVALCVTGLLLLSARCSGKSEPGPDDGRRHHRHQRGVKPSPGQYARGDP